MNRALRLKTTLPARPKFCRFLSLTPWSLKSYHFYQNKVLEPYVNQPISASTLRQYIFFGRQMNNKRLAKSANWVRNELLVRLAHRIRDFQQLPFFVGTNPHIKYIYGLYWAAFEKLRKSPQIKTMEDNQGFCTLLRQLLEEGRRVIPQMALGVSECASYYADDQQDLDRFVNRMFRSRISRRVLTEQHLALTEACENDWDESMGFGDGYIGIIFTRCSARAIVGKARKLLDIQAATKFYSHYHGKLPPPSEWKPPAVEIELQPAAGSSGNSNEIIFAYIPEQLEQILYEILSNSVRFTMANHPPHAYPPVRVTVSVNETDVFFRVSDQGGGIPKTRFDRLWSYQARAPDGEFLHFEDVQKMPSNISERLEQNTTDGPMHLGMGLPLSRVYAEYWGGELQIMTMDGYGTDAYVRIPRLGIMAENIGFDKFTPHQLHQHRYTRPQDTQSNPHATKYHPDIPLAAGDGWMKSSIVRT
ncbi:branched-chain alpha-ketoacid dehydrogenase kinase [Phycomyces blakesleeanus]|uniref:Protein-serine/threonine kinase n=2 Tax=Phycomyces blakesleeanus TaxID=4837 RepID=A0ABR3AYX9_PHYBL